MPEIFTIGHSNHPAAVFGNRLVAHQIEVLIDVRSRPTSRFPHFSRDNLIGLTNKYGVKYLYGGTSLGGLTTEPISQTAFTAQMLKIAELSKEKRVALMCSEGKPCECHRAGKLTRWLHEHRPGIKTTHILPDSSTIDAREYEPSVNANVRWKEFWPWPVSAKALDDAIPF
jgi:uncharacterized protein (DUF488 family)